MWSSRVLPIALTGIASSAACTALSGLDGLAVVDAPESYDASSDTRGPKDVADGWDQDTSGGLLEPLCDPNDPALAYCFPFEGSAQGRGDANASVTNVMYAPGRVGQGALFDGISSSISISVSPVLEAMTAVTIEVFVRPALIPVGTSRAGLVDSGGRFGLFIVPSGFVCSGGGSSITTHVPLVADKVTHLACTSDGTSLSAFQDGVLVDTIAVTPIQPSGANLAIGMNEPNGEYFHGLLDELRIYGRARTAAEISLDALRGR
jgi:hypothetical protein